MGKEPARSLKGYFLPAAGNSIMILGITEECNFTRPGFPEWCWGTPGMRRIFCRDFEKFES